MAQYISPSGVLIAVHSPFVFGFIAEESWPPPLAMPLSLLLVKRLNLRPQEVLWVGRN